MAVCVRKKIPCYLPAVCGPHLIFAKGAVRRGQGECAYASRDAYTAEIATPRFCANAHSLRHFQAYDWWKHGSSSNGAKSRDRRQKPGSSTISQGLLEDRGGDKSRSPKATGGSVLAVGHRGGTGKAPRPRRVLIRGSQSRTLLRIYEHTPGDVVCTHATKCRSEATMCYGSQPIREGVLSGVYPYSDRSIISPK